MDSITVGRLFKQRIDTISDYIDFSTGEIWIDGLQIDNSLWPNPPKKEMKIRKKLNPYQIVTISCLGWQEVFDSILIQFYSRENFKLSIWVDKKSRLVTSIIYEGIDVENAIPGFTPGWGYSENKREVLENLTFEDFINKAEE